MGGFCDLETLEGVMAAHPDNPDIPMTPPFPVSSVASTIKHPRMVILRTTLEIRPIASLQWKGGQYFMFHSDYNNRYRGPDAGRGGTFSRNGLIEIFHDIVAAYGNPLFDNPESNYFPLVSMKATGTPHQARINAMPNFVITQ